MGSLAALLGGLKPYDEMRQHPYKGESPDLYAGRRGSSRARAVLSLGGLVR